MGMVARDPYWDRLRKDLAEYTIAELKALSRAEHISLGYSASRKDSLVGTIVAQRRHEAVESLDDATLCRRMALRGAYAEELARWEHPPTEFDESTLRSTVVEECFGPGVRWHPVTDEGEEVGFLVLGHAWIYCHPMCDRHVCQTYVEPGHRGRGLMAAILGETIGAPRVETVSLCVLKENDAAKSFWRHVLGSMGFRFAPDIPDLGKRFEDTEEWHFERMKEVEFL